MLAIGVTLSTLGCFLILILIYWSRSRPSGFPPGPLGIPFLGYLPFLGRYPHKTFTKLSKTYGNIFSIYFGSYPVVVLNDFESVKAAYKSDDFLGRPDITRSLVRIEDDGNYGLGFSEGDVWFKQKRLAVKGLRDACYGQISNNYENENDQSRLEKLIKKEISSIEENFRGKKGPILFKGIFIPYMMRLNWRLLSNDASESEVKSCSNAEEELIHSFMEAFFDTSIASTMYFVPIARFFASYMAGIKAQKKLLVKIVKLIRDLVDDHVKNPSSGKTDFIYSYLNELKVGNKDENFQLDEEETKNLIYTILDLIITTYDSAANSLEWLFLVVLKHPDSIVKLVKEIDEVIGNREPTASDKANMPYTEALINEAYRFVSFGPIGFPRRTLRKTQIGGFTLPKNTITMLNMHGIHHDKSYWGQDAESFIPERFLNVENGKYVKNERHLTFTLGKRACPGESYGITMVFLFLTTLFQKYDFSLAKEATLEPQIGVAWYPKPYEVNVALRKK